MNKEWSDLNKKFQNEISKKATFNDGINTLLELRNLLFKQVKRYGHLDEEKLATIAYPFRTGYDSKSIAYSIYHIARIEDLVLNTLILKVEPIFKWYKDLLNLTITTTGNELSSEKLEEFSHKINKRNLFDYIDEVYHATNKYLLSLTYEDLKIKFILEDKERLLNSGAVHCDYIELIDYWSSRNIKGLLQMPFSRHWIMHIEACERIKVKMGE